MKSGRLREFYYFVSYQSQIHTRGEGSENKKILQTSYVDGPLENGIPDRPTPNTFPVGVVEGGGLDGAGLPRLQRRLARHLEGDDVATPVMEIAIVS